MPRLRDFVAALCLGALAGAAVAQEDKPTVQVYRLTMETAMAIAKATIDACLGSLSERVRHKLIWENALRLYEIEAPPAN